MKQKMALLFFLAALALTACSSDPQWADPEAHEKTEQLREQYTPFIVGTWHWLLVDVPVPLAVIPPLT